MDAGDKLLSRTFEDAARDNKRCTKTESAADVHGVLENKRRNLRFQTATDFARFRPYNNHSPATPGLKNIRERFDGKTEPKQKI